MDFSFLTPSAFNLLYALPLLVVPYLLRERGKRVVVPALFLYQGLSSSARRRLWGRLQLTPLFLLQLLILLLLVIAAAQPFVQHEGRKIALVLDTSASMHARLPEGGRSVVATATTRAAQILGTIPSTDTVVLFTNTPLPAQVSLPDDTREQIAHHLTQLTATDAPDPSDEVMAAFFLQLIEERDFSRVVFFTDRPLAAPVDTAALTVLTLAEAQPNWGITAFRLYRSPFFPDTVDATLVIKGTADMHGGSVSIENAETGTLLQSRPLARGDSLTVSFPDLPLAATYRARIFAEDALAVDNEAYAVLPTLAEVPVLLVTASPQVAKSVRQIPNLKLESVTPQEYQPAQAAGFAFVLFHLTAPDTLPPTNAAFILPPDGNSFFPFAQASTQVRVTQWTTAHPLTAYVTFSLLAPVYAEAFLPVGWCKPVVSATVGPVLLACERDGKRYAAVGFDLFPYLGSRNLPTSILTLNLLGWLADHAGQPLGWKTGATLMLPEDARIRLPDGETVAVTGGMFSFAKQGVYTISEHGVERRVAVNLTNAEESRLGRPLQLPSVAATEAQVPETTGQPLWPWLLLAALLLLGIERWMATRSVETEQPA